MSTPIKTNKISYKLDRKVLSSHYDVFKILTSEKYFKKGAYILDAPLMNDRIKAISFTSGNSFYVLLRHDDQNSIALKEVLKKTEDYERVSFSEEKIIQIADNVLLQLLINALGSVDSPFLRFNNLTGHLYCFNPKWIQHGKKNNADIIKKIPTLELSVTPELQLDMKVRTFTSSLLRSQIEFNRRKYEEYPKYSLSSHNTLRRRLQKDEGECFILRQTRGDKTEIPFLDISSLTAFEQSKMGVLESIKSLFNMTYAEFAALDFYEVREYASSYFKAKTKKENLSHITKFLENKSVRIVDQVLNNYSHSFCEEVKATIKKRYGLDCQIGKRVKQNAFNICLIHNAAYYCGKDDPHSLNHGEAIVQHISFEDFLGNSEFAVSTIVNELVIKHDLKQKKISLYDWSGLAFKNDIVFGLSSKDDEIDHYYFMVISKDGSFSISEHEVDLFDIDSFSDCMHVLEETDCSSGVIKDYEGNLISIHDTGWITIPEISKIHNELCSGNNKLRGAEARLKFLSASLDVKSFDYYGGFYYFVGEIGEGMRPKVVHAANIRKIEASTGSAKAFEKMLPLMSVSFVRNGQLTVVPFPFKYLREYRKCAAKGIINRIIVANGLMQPPFACGNLKRVEVLSGRC